jgi:hypothetical protein
VPAARLGDARPERGHVDHQPGLGPPLGAQDAVGGGPLDVVRVVDGARVAEQIAGDLRGFARV